jgi:hypothetical protein
MNKKNILILAVAAVSLSSCSDYLDNTNINSPLESALPPRLILPGAQAQNASYQHE